MLPTPAEAIGGGGGSSYRSGAGGGEYRKITNASYTASATRTCQIGAGGVGSTTNGSAGGNGTFTQLLADNNSTVALKAFGANGTIYGATAGGAGGTGGTGAGGNFNGGAGGTSNGNGGGGGGGGAAGPSGVGGAGVSTMRRPPAARVVAARTAVPRRLLLPPIRPRAAMV